MRYPIKKPSGAKAKNREADSAQLTIDYVAGIGIFMLSVAFVFQFMYSLFAPFQSNSDEVTLAADRASTILVERLLAADKPGAMNIIDQGKLYYFNNTRLNHFDRIEYTGALRDLGLLSNETILDMNMSVTHPNGTIMKQRGTSFPLISGPEIPDNLDIGQTKRFVLIMNSSTGYNETAIISVRVW